MFEDLIISLDELGVTYTEDESTLTIDIADIDKSLLIDVIAVLYGYTFDIDESSITVMGTDQVEEDTEYDEEAYLDDAFAQM